MLSHQFDLSSETLLSPENSEKEYTFLCRVYSIRAQKRMTFLVLRKGEQTIQGIVFGQKLEDIYREAVVEVTCKFVEAKVPIKSEETSIKDRELHISNIRIVGESDPNLPLQIISTNWGDENARNLALNHRVLDLRTKQKQAVFKLKSYLLKYLREALDVRDFMQIHTPKLTGVSSEGGAEVFSTKYFGKDAFLAQSPQLYKQMCINSDFPRVYEIGPVFRAENSNDKRHLTEFIGVDLEMQLSSDAPDTYLKETLPTLYQVLVYTFTKLELNHADMIQIANPDYQSILLGNLTIVDWPDAIQMLREQGVEIGDYEDLNREKEALLGEQVRNRYDTDIFILNRFPSELRPFYTMLDSEDPRYTRSYDVIIRGQEVMSGAQRIHDLKMLTQRAEAKGVNLENLDFYVDSFKYGSWPHAGGGFGLERLLCNFLGFDDIRMASLFPRDPKRIKP